MKKINLQKKIMFLLLPLSKSYLLSGIKPAVQFVEHGSLR